MSDKGDERVTTELESARRSLARNIAYCLHWAMWKRGMSEPDLVAASGLPPDLVRSALLAEAYGMTTGQLSELFFALDMRPQILIEAIDKAATPHPDGGSDA